MNIEEIKIKQDEILNANVIKDEIKNVLLSYNEECDKFSTRYNKILTDIVLGDVHNFFKESKLSYHQPDNRSFMIEGFDKEICILDNGFNINTKNGYKSFTIELEKRYHPNECVWKQIKFNNKFISTNVEDSFRRKIIAMNLYELKDIFEIVKSSINDVKKEYEDLQKYEINPKSLRYNYYEFGNEKGIYKSITKIIENEIS